MCSRSVTFRARVLPAFLQRWPLVARATSLIFRTKLIPATTMESLDEPPRTGNVDFLDLIPCLGLCCCFLSCYTEMPDCLGTVCESTLCCVNVRSLLCKTGKEEEIYCKCISCEIDVIPCSVCVKSRSQVCCLDLRAAFPPKDDFPCILNLLCCTVTLSLSLFSLHRS